MKILYFLVVVSAVDCTVWSEAEFPFFCNTEELTKCFTLLKDDKFWFSISSMCQDMNRGVRCIDRYTRWCMTEEGRHHIQRLFNGSTQLIEKLCHPGPFQEELQIHAPCLGKYSGIFEHCVHPLDQKTGEVDAKVIDLYGIPPNEMSAKNDSDLRTVCCSYHDYFDCTQRLVMKKCGAQTAKFTVNIFKQSSPYFIKDFCPHYSDQCPGSSASRNSPLALLLPICLAMISLYALRPN